MKSALILIDIQNDYFPGGAMELAGMSQAAAQARELLAACRQARRPIFHVQHLALGPGATFFRPDTPGWKSTRASGRSPARPSSGSIIPTPSGTPVCWRCCKAPGWKK